MSPARRRPARPRADPRPARRPRPAQATRDAYQPAPGTALLTCALTGCGASYLDDQPGRDAHLAVFGHRPQARPRKDGG